MMHVICIYAMIYMHSYGYMFFSCVLYVMRVSCVHIHSSRVQHMFIIIFTNILYVCVSVHGGGGCVPPRRQRSQGLGRWNPTAGGPPVARRPGTPPAHRRTGARRTSRTARTTPRRPARVQSATSGTPGPGWEGGMQKLWTNVDTYDCRCCICILRDSVCYYTGSIKIN